MRLRAFRCVYLLRGPSSPLDQVLDLPLRRRNTVRLVCKCNISPYLAPPCLQPPQQPPLTFRRRFFSMPSTAKTCSPAAGSSILGLVRSQWSGWVGNAGVSRSVRAVPFRARSPPCFQFFFLQIPTVSPSAPVSLSARTNTFTALRLRAALFVQQLRLGAWRQEGEGETLQKGWGVHPETARGVFKIQIVSTIIQQCNPNFGSNPIWRWRIWMQKTQSFVFSSKKVNLGQLKITRPSSPVRSFGHRRIES